MGETRVDLLHLLEDLRDAYPGSLEETMLTEIMANALDSGASVISFESDPALCTLAVTDNGSGMRRRELARFHDIAASTKVRGQGIGFAGVGIKLGLLVCEEVMTNAAGLIAASLIAHAENGGEVTAMSEVPHENRPESPAATEPTPPIPPPPAAVQLPGKAGLRRPAHYGLDIQFEDRPDDSALGRLIESTVWVNRAHPAYRRANASRSLGYHIALTVAMALAPLAVEPLHQNSFVLAFLSRWGEAIDNPARRRRQKRV